MLASINSLPSDVGDDLNNKFERTCASHKFHYFKPVYNDGLHLQGKSILTSHIFSIFESYSLISICNESTTPALSNTIPVFV